MTQWIFDGNFFSLLCREMCPTKHPVFIGSGVSGRNRHRPHPTPPRTSVEIKDDPVRTRSKNVFVGLLETPGGMWSRWVTDRPTLRLGTARRMWVKISRPNINLLGGPFKVLRNFLTMIFSPFRLESPFLQSFSSNLKVLTDLPNRRWVGRTVTSPRDPLQPSSVRRPTPPSTSAWGGTPVDVDTGRGVLESTAQEDSPSRGVEGIGSRHEVSEQMGVVSELLNTYGSRVGPGKLRLKSHCPKS